MIPRAVLPTLVGLVLALSLAAIEARAQAPAAVEHVVVLATVPTMAQRPTTPIPAAFRGNSLYWRVLKSGDTVAYQLCLGFFETRKDAERAREQLAAGFREARVIQVNPQERENLQNAARTAKPAPPSAATAVPSLTVAAQSLLQQADAAYSVGERERARRLYRDVLASEPNNSRAAYQLARLSPPGSAEAIALLRRYVELEPGDPWGYMALGDSLAAAGAASEAVEQYGHARRRAPDEPDVYVGLGRILRDAGRTDALVKNYEEWVSRQPKNAQAWSELGRARQRAKRHAEAADAYASSYAIEGDEHTLELLDNALAESAFSLRPYLGRSDDSDQNRVTRWGLEGEWQFTARSRLGLRAERNEVRDPATSGTVDALALFARWQPLGVLKLDGLAGIARLSADLAGQKAASRPLGGLRLRWRSPAEGPALELRAAQNPLIATPGLVAQPVELSEIKGSIDVPLIGPLRARARGQSGVLDAATDVNHRSGYQFGPVYRWRPAAELGAFYSELGYEHPTTAGYFAPRRAQVIEVGTYLEYEGLSPLTFALDAGAGRQRVARQGETVGDWITTYRLWALASWTPKPGMSLDLEVEHYDSPVAGNGVTPTSNWSFNSATLSLRFGVRPETARSFLAERADRNSMPAR
jgi:tetratricopeptide (TPR) repeat protein